ncbi:MAG: PA2778 family cysteine peptidase [Acidiferrobacterales bacterium]
MSGVPFFPQKAYQCGPASLAMALNWAGVKVKPDQLAPEVYLPKRRGSLQIELVAAARRNGRVAYVIRPGLPSLLTELGAGNPVVILENLGLNWYPVWHYAVAVDVNVAADEIVLRSGDIARQKMPLGLFERTWARSGDWGLLVLPPDRLPATADKRRYLRAVAGLERVRHFRVARVAYATALRRWPDSLVARIGLGNSCYALTDLAGAEDAYRKAALLHPGSGIAYNNLAQTLADEGRLAAAAKAAHHAVTLGGPLLDTYRKTLGAIEIRQAAGTPTRRPQPDTGRGRQNLPGPGVGSR